MVLQLMTRDTLVVGAP